MDNACAWRQAGARQDPSVPMNDQIARATDENWTPRRLRTRERLLAAAQDIISEVGFHRATLDDIAARAGLTKGAIYDNFSSKEQLFIAVVAAWMTGRSRQFAWPRGHAGSLKLRLRQFAEAVIADAPAAQSEAPMRAQFFLYLLTHEEMRRCAAEVGVARRASMREAVQRFVAEEELPLPLDTFVLVLEALVSGLVFIRSVEPSTVTDEVIISIFESLAGVGAKD
jgi:AcrR family transcriptional regulator